MGAASTFSAGRPIVVDIHGVAKRFVLRRDRSVKDRMLQSHKSKSNESSFWALRGVSAQLEAGSTVGLIGPNGSGKSTLLKVIGGIIQADDGSVKTRGRLAALLELGAGFHPDLSGRDNVYLNAAIFGMSKEETDARFDDIVAFSGISQFIDTAVKFYSSGMYVRLAFAVAVHSDPDILLVDEVLAVGDELFQQKCLDKIEEFQKEGRTIVIVSHSMGQITALCDRVMVLEKGNLVFDGNPYDAVDVMRRGFLGQGLDDVNVIEDGEPGSHREETARISSITPVLSRDGEMDAGEDLVVDIEFSVPDRMEKWDLTLEVVSALGATVITTSARAVGLTTTAIVGDNRVRFRLPDLRAGEGGYSLSSALFDERQREVCRSEGRGAFHINAGPESIGYVYSQAVGHLEVGGTR